MSGKKEITKIGEKPEECSDKYAHHKDGEFINPWPSYRSEGSSLSRLLAWRWNRTAPELPSEDNRIQVKKPDLERIASFCKNPEDSKDMLLTWLGHAAFLLTVKGLQVLFDPCLSDRCSPISFLGPKRVVPTPCTLEELPRIDAVVISHNHYDHLDLPTIKKLANSDTWFFVPLGNKKWFLEQGFHNVIEMDWWDEYKLERNDSSINIACTPCQHFSSRSLTDRNATLWSSWVITNEKSRFFFGGDTGYRTVLEGENEDLVPTCPVFKEIGEKYGPFTLSAIPIGAYSPRWFMSPVHCNPKDAVDVHLDVKSRKSIGMHWGTFMLSDEPYTEPPILLKAELEKRGLDSESFRTISIGESVTC